MKLRYALALVATALVFNVLGATELRDDEIRAIKEFVKQKPVTIDQIAG